MSNEPAGAAPTRVTDRLCEFLSRIRWERYSTGGPARSEAFADELLCHRAGGLPRCRRGNRFRGSWPARRERHHDTIIGRHERSDRLTSAFLNAVSANVFDFEDTHTRTIIHPTAPVAPALFALAESSRMSGEQLLLAFVLGVETECRIGNAISPWHYQRGWHITSTCGVFGAAAAAGKALGLNAKRMKWALGNASAQSSGLVETLGSMSKSIGVGNAARNGLLSALLAERDFSGPDQPLEGARCFLRVTGENPDFACITEGLGEHWEIIANTYKPYPCGVVLNPVIEACLALSPSRDLDIAQVERIEITGHPILRERTDRPHIITGREAQVSVQHAVAVALTKGRAVLPEFSDGCVADVALRALGNKVRFVDDASYKVESAQVTVHTRTAAPVSYFVEQARGSNARPLSDSDLENKLRDLAHYDAPGRDREALIQAVWALDRTSEAGALMRLAAGFG